MFNGKVLKFIFIASLLYLLPAHQLQAQSAAVNSSSDNSSLSSSSESSTSAQVSESKIERIKQAQLEKQGDPSLASVENLSWYPMLKGLGICIGLLAVMIFLNKKLGLNKIASGKKRVKVLERVALTPKTAIYLVSIDGAEMFLSVGADRVTSLKESFPSESNLTENI